MDATVRTKAERHKELLEAAQSLLELLDSPQKHLYIRCSPATKPMPNFDPHDYFESRGMTVDEQTMGLLHDLLKLYDNALAHIVDFNLKQKYLSAPYLEMDDELLKASGQIAELDFMFSENRKALRRFMIANGMLEGVIVLNSKE